MAIANRCDGCEKINLEGGVEFRLDTLEHKEYCPTCYSGLPLSRRCQLLTVRAGARVRNLRRKGAEWLTGWSWLFDRRTCIKRS